MLLIFQDVNDNSPIFLRTEYYVSVSRDITPGTPIGQAKAHDADSGLMGRVTYMLLEPVSDLFGVDRNTGIVYVATPLHNYGLDKHKVSTLSLVQKSIKISLTLLLLYF